MIDALSADTLTAIRHRHEADEHEEWYASCCRSGIKTLKAHRGVLLDALTQLQQENERLTRMFNAATDDFREAQQESETAEARALRAEELLDQIAQYEQEQRRRGERLCPMNVTQPIEGWNALDSATRTHGAVILGIADDLEAVLSRRSEP